MEKTQATETTPPFACPPAYDLIPRRKTFRDFSLSSTQFLDFLGIFSILNCAAYWDLVAQLGIKDQLSLHENLPSLFADFAPGICLAKTLGFSLLCWMFFITRTQPKTPKLQICRALSIITMVVSLVEIYIIPAIKEQQLWTLEPEYSLLFYDFLETAASFTASVIALACSGDLDLNYGCLLASNRTSWNGFFGKGKITISDAGTQEGYRLLTNPSLKSWGRAAQALARFGEWLIFFLIMVQRACFALLIFTLGTMMAIGTGLIASAPLEETDILVEIVCSKSYFTFVALLMILITPIFLLRSQFARKHREFDAEMKELCGGGEVLLTVGQDPEKGDCEPTGTEGADQDCGKGQDNRSGWIVFVLMLSLYYLSL